MAPSVSAQTKKLLATRIHLHRKELWEWHLEHARRAPPPFYCSVDLRDSGHKIVPVDSNLYPAGFNNICPDDLRAAPPILRAQIEAQASRSGLASAKRVLVLPEAHTSNTYYIENLHYLTQLLVEAGFDMRVGWYGSVPEGQPTPLVLKSATGKEVLAHPIRIEGNTLKAGDFEPDLVLLNNDFSSGYPKELDGLKQPILPSHTLGWHSRKKSEHFRHYNRLAAEFAQIIDVDPWILQIDTEEVGPVNFNEDQGIEEAAQAVERVLERTREAYERHKVTRKPFAFVKNNSGTYGMGIMVVHSADDLRKMNRRTKNKMSVGKNKLPIGSVAVQEGVPTATLVDRLAAEPVIYLVGCELIGGFLRTNTEKGDEENLNSQGMVFKKLCMSDLKNPLEPEEDEEPSPEPALELVYGSIARISALATGLELAVPKP
jgi:glutamate--cysteine ligase